MLSPKPDKELEKLENENQKLLGDLLKLWQQIYDAEIQLNQIIIQMSLTTNPVQKKRIRS